MTLPWTTCLQTDSLAGTVLYAGNPERSAFAVMAIDVFPLADATDLIDRVVHCHQECATRVALRWIREHLLDAIRQTHAPTTIAAAGAETDTVGFKHGDIEIWLGLFEVVGAPQARVPGAYDRNVY